MNTWRALQEIGAPEIRPRHATAVRVLTAFWLGLGWAVPALAAPHATTETAGECITTGDFDGDSRLDVLIVDKSSGNFRLGRMNAGGLLEWLEAGSVGFSPVATLTAGRFASRATDSFVVADPLANRLHEIRIDPTGAPVITPLFPWQFGPDLVLALNPGRSGQPAVDDLLIGSVLNSRVPNQLGLYTDPASAFTFLNGFELGTSRAVTARAVPVQRDSFLMAGVILRDAAAASFRLIDLHTGTIQTALQLATLPLNSEFSAGFVSGTTTAHLLLWDPTDAAGTLRARSILPGTGGAWSLGTETQYQFGEAIRQAEILNPAGVSELALAFASGRAETFTFDGLAVPTRIAELAAGFPNLQSFVVLGPDRVVALGGTGDGPSEYFSLRQRNGNTWNAIQEGPLPDLVPLRGVATLWEYQGEPFVAANPGFVGQRVVDDWTTAANRGAMPQLIVTAEGFRSATLGLGNASAVNSGLADAGTQHVLVNQVHPSISVFGLNQPGPRVAGSAHPVPAPGDYARSVALQFHFDPPTATGVRVLYRFDDQGDWLTYLQPVYLYRATTLSYFTVDTTLARTGIRSARYTFQAAAGRLDADSDGVPDYVEVALGLDPRAGADTDRDGVNDLDEIVAGTNPAMATSVPPLRTSTANATIFSARVTPTVYDGRVNQFSAAREGVLVGALTPQGQVLDKGPIVAAPAPRLGGMLLPHLPRSPTGRLLSLSLPSNFQGVPPAPGDNPFFGRELLALRTSPPRAMTEVPFEWVSGDAVTAANTWIAAARSSLGIAETLSEWELSPNTTLAAVLFERKIETLLHARELLAPQWPLTLFPHRPQDAGRHPVTDSVLLRLESLGPIGAPAYTLAPALQTITEALNAAAAASLRDLALDIYRISSRQLDLPTTLPLPLDALRQFIKTGQLPEGYAAKSSLTAAALRQAVTSTTTLLAAPFSRPYLDRVLVVPANSSSPLGCSLLYDDFGAPWSLIDPAYQPWRLYDAFALPAGTRLRVRGFTDGPPTCGTSSILVETLAFESLPETTSTDTDGDQMDDIWERRYFGSLAPSGLGDFDGDGFSNLQEFLEGTNPSDAGSRGIRAVILSSPVLALEFSATGALRIRFEWPEPFASRMSFDVRSTDALGNSFSSLGLAPTRAADGVLTVDRPVSPESTQFFQIQMSLR